MLYSIPNPLRSAHVTRVRIQKHRWWRPLLWAGLLALMLLAVWQTATSGALLAADAIALSEPWRFVDESKPGVPVITGELTPTNGEAPAQVVARFAIRSTMEALALQLFDADLGGLPLAEIEELRYCTRLIDAPLPYAVMLQINIDADVSDEDESWQGRLVYSPADNGAIIQGEWQCWNTLVGKWWATGGPVASYAPAGNPQPLGTLLARFPNLGIHDRYSVVALKAGDGWSRFEGEASPVVIGVAGERISIAFGTAPEQTPQENEVLLPVVFNEPVVNEPQASPQGENDGKNQNKGNKKKDKEKDKDNKDKDKAKEGKNDKKPENDWRSVNWNDVDWDSLDWDSLDWEKVDWEKLDWAAFGWFGAGRSELIRAFVKDVKACQGKGWDKKGFSTPGLCVAYYVKEHTPAGINWRDLNWRDAGWGRDSWDDGNRNGHRNRGNND